jgi:hypothetical protein
MLDHKRTAGERPKTRQHYLRGSVFCGSCGQRLTFGITTGRHGKKYPYFFCSARINGTTCEMRFNIAPKKIEAAIAEHYRTVQLTPTQIEKAKDAIRKLAEVSEGALQHIRMVKTQLIAKLEQKQDNLLDLYDEKSISKAVFTRRQAKLEDELHAARTSLAETEHALVIDQAQLAKALELAHDVRQVYLAADHRTRRGYNQAFFEKLLVDAEAEPGSRTPKVSICGAKLTEPYALLLAEDLLDRLETEAAAFAPRNEENTCIAGVSNVGYVAGARRQGSKAAATPGSIFEQLVPGVGFEPTRPCRRRILSPLRLPFRHPGR